MRLPVWSLLGSKLAAGGIWTFGFFFMAGLVLLCVLFLTVHNRRPAALDRIQEQGRYRDTIMTWIEEGPLKYGDYRLIAPYEKKWTKPWGPMDESKDYLYGHPMGFLRPAYLLQLIHYTAIGHYSETLMVLHNQLIVAIAGALLSLLAFRVAAELGVDSFSCFALGLSCLAVYQTFPYNLEKWWEIYPASVAAVPLIVFLILIHELFDRNDPPAALCMGIAVSVFFVFYFDYFSTGVFLVSGYLVAFLLMGRQWLPRHKLFWTVFLPVAFWLVYLFVQNMVVSYVYPDLAVVRSSVLSRMGLDGDKYWYIDHWHIIWGNGRDRPIGYWLPLFFGGVAAVATLAKIALKKPEARRMVILLGIALAAYVPQVFILSQSAAIHPYHYDVLLVIPLTVALFGFLPAWLEMIYDNSGIFAFLFFTAAFCYSFVQLRTYAIAYPTTEAVRWFSW